jgi:heat shock protein HslJ
VASTVLIGWSPQPAPTLPDTTWQLVSIQSMDDAAGTTAVPDASKFTVTFSSDGYAFFQIDCNRGRGTYKTEASGDGTSGTLEFGPIATTRMMCPQPSLDQAVSTALADVRTYLFKDDRLHLSKVADGGILTWKRI